MSSQYFSEDLQEFFCLLQKYRVKYVIVGGEAVIYYGYARFTGDVDFFYKTTPQNAELLFKALQEFWGGEVPGLSNWKELLEEGTIIQFGTPPNRIDLINTIDGVDFEEAWQSRVEETIEFRGKNCKIYYIGLEALIKNKKAAGRYKDFEDLKFLEAALKKKRTSH